jgi:hypothetical protein
MMKKIVISVLLAVVSQCGCGVFFPSARVEEPNEDGQVGLVDIFSDQETSSLLWAEKWTNKYGPGVTLTTEHYEVYTTLLDPFFLWRIPGFMERAHQAYSAQLPYVVDPGESSKVYIFKDREQWEDFTRIFTGKQAKLFLKIRQGAYCYKGSCVAYDIGPKRTLAALSHEGWHQFSSRHFKFRLPSWLDEGLAMQFEGFHCVSGEYVFEPSLNHYRKRALASVLNEQDSIDLKELLCISPGEVMATDRAESVMAFYSQSYALVRFLQEACAGKYLADYQRLIRDGLLGQWPLCFSDRTVAENRDLARTVDWNGRVGIQLFRSYVCEEIPSLEDEYLSFCWEISR